jgi:hypothetical protein
VTNAMEAIRQRVEEEAADELAGFERHDLGVAAVAIVLTWGASGQGGDSFCVLQLTWLVRFDFSLFVSVGRYFAVGSWRRKWRARDEGQGCELAKPACAEPTSFYISVSRSGAQLSDAARFRARSTSHPVAARDGCTNIPLTAGRGSGERNHSSNRHFSPWTTSVRTPGSARTDQVLGDLRIC